MTDLLPALRSAVLEIGAVTAELPQWGGEPAVFTRRPVPADAEDLLVLINPATSITDQDGLTSVRPVVAHDIAVYGRKGAPGAPEDQTRVVDRIAFALREHFHRNRFSVQLAGFQVIDVRVTGPVPAPTDDDETVGRLVSLMVRLRRTG
jgi:hypothetical protein